MPGKYAVWEKVSRINSEMCFCWFTSHKRRRARVSSLVMTRSSSYGSVNSFNNIWATSTDAVYVFNLTSLHGFCCHTIDMPASSATSLTMIRQLSLISFLKISTLLSVVDMLWLPGCSSSSKSYTAIPNTPGFIRSRLTKSNFQHFQNFAAFCSILKS